MEWAILSGLVAAVIAVALWNRRRKQRALEAPPPAPTTQPLTPEEIEQRKFLGEEWERWKRENGVGGP